MALALNQNQVKKKYSSEIIRDYCETYSDMPTLTLAKMILKNHPLDFPSLDSTRAYVRKWRNEHGTNDYKESEEFERTEKQKKDAQANKDWHDIPETDYVETPVFEIPKGNNRIFILSDVHIPYHDRKAIEIAVDYAKKRNPNVLYLNGDTMDCYQASRFVKDRRLRDLAGELDLTKAFLDYLRQEFPKAKIYYKVGNHDERWETYLKTHAPALLGIDDFLLENLLRFGERGIGLVKSKQIARAGKLMILHGHEFFSGFGNQVNPARTAFLRSYSSVIIGHHHQTSQHTEKTLDDKIITTHSMGCLCGLKPEYMIQNKWNSGFAFLEVDPDGSYLLSNNKIIDGEVY